MSRIGKAPVAIPEKVEVKVEGKTITTKGGLGELTFDFRDEAVKVEVQEWNVVVTPVNEDSRALWGTTRAVIQNMVIGVSEGFKKSLEINGVGYKFEVQWQKLVLSIGYSHKVDMEVPGGIKVTMDEKEKNICLPLLL